MSIENENPENENLNPETDAAENQPVEETVTSQNSETETESEHQETEVVEEDFSHYSLKEALDEMEKIVNKDDASSFPDVSMHCGNRQITNCLTKSKTKNTSIWNREILKNISNIIIHKLPNCLLLSIFSKKNKINFINNKKPNIKEICKKD
jgi:hypothetical protein